jgi:hypothetical protein
MFYRFPKSKSEEKRQKKFKTMLTVLKMIDIYRFSLDGVARIKSGAHREQLTNNKQFNEKGLA